jgi:hypothetical protein
MSKLEMWKSIARLPEGQIGCAPEEPGVSTPGRDHKSPGSYSGTGHGKRLH